MDTTSKNITGKNRRAQKSSRLVTLSLGAVAAIFAAGVWGQTPAGPHPAATSSASVVGATSKAASGGPALAPVVLPEDFASLRIAPGDLLSVSVYDVPEFSDDYRVDSAGNLALPLCGRLKVGGLTSNEAAKLLETTLIDKLILVRPQVNVDVKQYAGSFVTVLGEVGMPGRVTVIAPVRLTDILAQAGGLTALAGQRIKIRHAGGEARADDDMPYARSDSNHQAGSMLVGAGDTVMVPRAGIVYVLGAVYHPGGYLMQEDGKLDVAQALALSGGTILTARTNGLRVIRKRADGSVLDFSLSYDGIAAGRQTPLELMAEDVVYVPMSKVKATLTDATSVLSAATSAAIYTAR
jgi:polysaccharide export outer membrane protein